MAGAGAERGQNIDLAPTGQATVTVANLGPEPLFVAVLAISSDWSVDVVNWDRAAAALPSGGEYSSGQVRLDVLGPEDEGFVRLVGVAARGPSIPSAAAAVHRPRHSARPGFLPVNVNVNVNVNVLPVAQRSDSEAGR